MMIIHQVILVLAISISSICSNPFFAHAFAPPASSLVYRQPFTSATPPVAIKVDVTRSISSSKNNIHRNNAAIILDASPSGIDEWPQAAQAGVFFGTYLALGLATYPTTKLLEFLSKSVMGLERWRTNVIESTLPLLLGFIYLAAGVGHFADAEAFRDIYPPPGTWGIWYLPGSAAFHVAWTGVVEGLGGAGLLFGGIRNVLRSDDDGDDDESFVINLIQPVSALTLFVLTILVTPANIYMFTHGAVMGADMPPLDMSFHAIRFAVQVIFLSLLITLAKDSFFFAWGDELD